MPRLGLGSSLTGGAPPDNPSFISTWTVSGNEAARTVALPLVENNVASSANTINFTIDWGDDTALEEIAAYNDDDRTHIYAENGTYTVTMSGTIQGFKFDNGDHKTKIRTITQWGTFNITNNSTFRGCSNLNVTATDTPTVSSTSLSLTFDGCSALTSIGGNWDVSAVDNMPYVFQNCTLFNQDLSSWDTSSVTTMLKMFQDADAFTNGGQPLLEAGNNWDVSSVEDFGSMFQYCALFNADISDWTTSSATSMTSMFNTTGAFNQDIGDWDTSNVANFSGMFVNCDTFNQDISGWDMGSLTAIDYFMTNNTQLSTANYNLLLHHWEADDPPDDLTARFGVGSDSSTGGVDGDAARTRLVDNHGWTIVDGDGTHAP